MYKVHRHGVLLAVLGDSVQETRTQYCDSVGDFIYLGGGNPNSILYGTFDSFSKHSILFYFVPIVLTILRTQFN